MSRKLNYDRLRHEQAIRRHGIEFNDPAGDHRHWGEESRNRFHSSPNARISKPSVVVVVRRRKSRQKDRLHAANISSLITIYQAEIDDLKLEATLRAQRTIQERQAQIAKLKVHLRALQS